MKTRTLLSFLLFLFLLSSAWADDSYKLVFETMDCSGQSGFASVGPEEIYKIENGDCADPGHPGQKMKQLLIHDGSGSYRAYSLTSAEARNVMRDLKEYMRARKGVLEHSRSIIVNP